MPPSLSLPSMTPDPYDHAPSLIEYAAEELERLRVYGDAETGGQNSSRSNSPKSVPGRTRNATTAPTSSALEYSSHPRRNSANGACSRSNDRRLIRSKTSPAETSGNSNGPIYHRFPPACLKIVRGLPGNSCCIDCGEADPQWASVSYGVLMCLQCSGYHRALGVQVSFIRHVSMDNWSHPQVLSMLEGGNGQLTQFFDRHSLAGNRRPDRGVADSGGTVNGSNTIVDKRYKTKAALFYREQLAVHIAKVADKGEYKGREATRKAKSKIKNENNRPSKSQNGSRCNKADVPKSKRKTSVNKAERER